MKGDIVIYLKLLLTTLFVDVLWFDEDHGLSHGAQ